MPHSLERRKQPPPPPPETRGVPPGLAMAWGSDLVEDFAERVAIMEDGGLDPATAYREAMGLCSVVHRANQRERQERLTRERTSEVIAAEAEAIAKANAEWAAQNASWKHHAKGKRSKRYAGGW